jgi:hypothetical protein
MINEMLDQLNQQVSKLAKDNARLITEKELLKCELRTVATLLRDGVSKIQQKTLARAIEENLKESI